MKLDTSAPQFSQNVQQGQKFAPYWQLFFATIYQNLFKAQIDGGTP